MQTDLFKTLDTISAFHSYNNWIYHNIRPFLSGTVLDIGSGIGDIAKHYFEDKSVSGVILSDGFDEMLDVLHSQFKEPYQVMRIDITDNSKLPKDLKVDTITCINVIEHIEDDAQALKNAASLLKDDGKIVIIVPALPAIYGTLDTLVGHYRRYTRTSFRAAAAKAGLVIKDEFYMNMPGIITWFIAGRILRRKKFDSKMGKTLDNIVPLIQSFENRIKPRIGQSLVSVCVKAR